MRSIKKKDDKLEDGLFTLRRWLQDAIEIEHSTIPPYLTAWLTIMDGHNREAADIIKSVLLEEMLHLTLAANILNAVKGSPDLIHQGFVPRYPHILPHSGGHFKIHIEKFSRKALKTFQKIEKPEAISAKSAGPGKFTSIDQFYAAVVKLMQDLCKTYGEDAVFTGDKKRQIQPEDFYGSGEVIVVHSLKTAGDAVRTIVDQGEGANHGLFDDDKAIFGEGDGRELAHYFRFNEIYKGKHYKAKDKPGKPTGSPISIDYEKVYPIHTDMNRSKIKKGTEVRKALDEFADSYGQLLKCLHRAFNGERAQMNQAMARMFAIRNQAQALIRTPLNKEETIGLDFSQAPEN
jgi:Ferritin-like